MAHAFLVSKNDVKKVYIKQIWDNNFNAIAFYEKLGIIHLPPFVFIGNNELLYYIFMKKIG